MNEAKRSENGWTIVSVTALNMSYKATNITRNHPLLPIIYSLGIYHNVIDSILIQINPILIIFHQKWLFFQNRTCQ